MQMLDSPAFWQWLMQVWMAIFIVGGLAGIAAGAGLYRSSERTLAFFNRLNDWTSMRRAVKPLEVPRDTTGIVQKHMRVLAVLFLVGGLYALYALFFQFDVGAVKYALGMDAMKPQLSDLIVDVARWLLVAGNVAAVAIGAMMAFAPARLTAIEASGSKWYSDRLLTQMGDQMHTPLDRWVAARPRAAGLIIGAGSLVVVVSATAMLITYA